MTVKELIEMLSEQSETAEVIFSYYGYEYTPSGDIGVPDDEEDNNIYVYLK